MYPVLAQRLIIIVTIRMTFKGIKKILVIKLRHIGDVILTIPVFRALRENFPDAHISALVNSGTEDVLTGNSIMDEIIVFDRNIKKKKPFQRYLLELSFLQNIRAKCFNMVVDLTSGDRAAIISFVSKAKYRLAYDPGKKGFWGKRHFYTHLSKKSGDVHMVLSNLGVVRQFGIDTDNLFLDFFIPEDARIFIKKIFFENGINKEDRIIHLHPTARWLFKCWKDEYIAEVIKWAGDKKVKVIITSSSNEGERDKVRRVLSLVSSKNVLNLSGKTTIKELAAVSEASDLFFGVDTAPMHIAAAVGTPVIALFGSGEKNWRPWGEGHKVISKETGDRDRMSREEYIRRNLELIRPAEVIEEIEDLLFKKIDHEGIKERKL
ncbi:MAG: putative lipopolysaccharide heptosyltransferase III [Nitrospirota bacterium]